MPTAGTDNRERGVILVIVLWIVASMSLLVSAFNVSVRSGATVLTGERHDAQRQAALESGLEVVVGQLLGDEAAVLWPRTGKPRDIQVGGARMRVGIQDANGLIDINKSDERLIFGLLEQVTGSRWEAERLRDRILDWRDDDDRRRQRGAEDSDYDSAGLDHGAGDTEFVDTTQLLDVLGMEPEVFRRLARFVTVYNRRGHINPQTAPRQVLAALPGTTDTDLALSQLTGEDETGNASEEVTDSAELLTRDMSKVMIVRIGLLDNSGSVTHALEAAVMPAFDSGAPYRLLSWRFPGPSPQPAGGRN